jgi:hypothetical protein
VRLTKSKARAFAGSIPDHLREAFRHAVWSYAGWNPAQPEPEVQVGDKRYALSAICGLMDGFNDRLSEDIFDRLMSICARYATRCFARSFVGNNKRLICLVFRLESLPKNRAWEDLGKTFLYVRVCVRGCHDFLILLLSTRSLRSSAIASSDFELPKSASHFLRSSANFSSR